MMTKDPVREWEEAWAKYIAKSARLEELKRQGRYGYQLRMPRKSLGMAIDRLKELDPDFCKRVLKFY